MWTPSQGLSSGGKHSPSRLQARHQNACASLSRAPAGSLPLARAPTQTYPSATSHACSHPQRAAQLSPQVGTAIRAAVRLGGLGPSVLALPRAMRPCCTHRAPNTMKQAFSSTPGSGSSSAGSMPGHLGQSPPSMAPVLPQVRHAAQGGGGLELRVAHRPVQPGQL